MCRIATVSLVRSIFAVLLLAAWPAVTSHALLERYGIIHEVHADHHHSQASHHDHGAGRGSHEHNDNNHDFADGGYVAKIGSNGLAYGVGCALYVVTSSAVVLESIDTETRIVFGPAPPGIAPPEFLHSLNFLLRTSADVRAPSSLA
jgi:hypothetical protein